MVSKMVLTMISISVSGRSLVSKARRSVSSLFNMFKTYNRYLAFSKRPAKGALMLETLSNGFRSARNFLNGQAVLTESNISAALNEVRTALLQADVALEVTDKFLARVQEKTLG